MDFLKRLVPNDLIDFYRLLERGVIALEQVAGSLASMDENYLSMRDFDKNP